jgi:hypothetical protein
MPRAKAKDEPIITSDVRKALEEASDHAYGIERALSDLDDEELESFIHWFQKRFDMKSPVYQAVIAAAEHQREVIDRHCTGRGKWFALVQAIRHPLRTEVGTIETLAAVECETRPAAVAEARRLLAEHADKITEDTEIEGMVVSELDDLAEGLRDRKSA